MRIHVKKTLLMHASQSKYLRVVSLQFVMLGWFPTSSRNIPITLEKGFNHSARYSNFVSKS